MKKLLFTFVVFCLTSCEKEEPPRVTIGYEIMNAFAKQKEKKDKMFLKSIGGRFIKGVEILDVGFETYQNLKLEDARKLYVRSVEELVDMMNSNEKIRPYLKDYPASYKNVELSISFKDISTKKRVKPPYIAYIYSVNDRVLYDEYDSKTDRLADGHKEPYKEAYKIVMGKELGE